MKLCTINPAPTSNSIGQVFPRIIGRTGSQACHTEDSRGESSVRTCRTRLGTCPTRPLRKILDRRSRYVIWDIARKRCFVLLLKELRLVPGSNEFQRAADDFARSVIVI